MYITTICLLNSAYLLGVRLYVYYHYLSTQLRLPAGSALVWTKSRARCINTSTDIVATVYTYVRDLMYIYVSDIYIYIATIRECP